MFNKLFRKVSMAVVGIAMAVGVGVAIGSRSETRLVKAEDVPSQTIGFESSEGFSTGTDYQSTQTYNSASPRWTVYYGTVSTSSKISGDNSLALRLYNSNNYGYARTTTGITYLNRIAFKAKAATSNGAAIKINIKYSNDNGSSWSNMLQTSDSGTAWSAKSLTSSVASYTAYMPAAAKDTSAETRFEFSIDSSSTKPSKSNVQLTIDDIAVYRNIPTGVSFINPTTSVLIGGRVTNTAFGSNLGGAAISYSSETPSVATVNSSTGEVTGVSAGTSVITASATVSETLYSANYTITVNTPVVSFVSPTTSVIVGNTVTNVATTNTGETISYSSGTTSVATVNSSTGVVTGVSMGTSVITASVTYAETVYSANYTIEVRALISDGVRYIMTGYKASDTSYYAMTGVSSNLGTATKKNNFYNATYSFTAEAGTGDYSGKWALKVGENQYIRYSADKKIDVGAADSTKAYWTASEGENGAIKLKNANATTYYLQFNDGSPRFTVYTGTQKDVYLTPVTDHLLVGSFIETKLHLHDYAGTPGEAGSGYCKDDTHNYYDKTGDSGAKHAFNHLTATQRAMFMNEEYTEFADARARLIAWAAANDETIGNDGVDDNVLKAAANYGQIFNSTQEYSANTFIIILSIVGIVSVSGYFFLRHRREEN